MTGRRGWSRVRGSSPTIMETSSPWVRTMIVYFNDPMIRRAKMINDVICWFQLFLTTGSICGWQPPWCRRAGQGRWRGQPHPSSLASSVICHNQHPCETAQVRSEEYKEGKLIKFTITKEKTAWIVKWKILYNELIMWNIWNQQVEKCHYLAKVHHIWSSRICCMVFRG